MNSDPRDELDISLRLTEPVDAAEIARIYNQGIADRIATFEVEPRTEGDIQAALASRGDRFPTVVAEAGDGTLIAVAWTSEYRSRSCYRGIAEFSVYTDRLCRGRGAGRRIMQRLIEECEARGLWKLTSRIFPENQASLALCRSLGFREVGVYKRHGKLEGSWRDCVIVELLIGEAAEL